MDNKLSKLQIISNQIQLRDKIIKEYEIEIIKLKDKIRGYKNTKIIFLSLLFISVIVNGILLLK